MRNTRTFFLAAILLLAVGNGVALADGMILPEALNPGYLAVRYHRVTVSITDGHAMTRVEQEFYNPHPSHVRGRYLFPVPPEAVLSRFQATVDGQAQEAVRQDPQTTNAELYTAVAERGDPSLLQYIDWETIAFDLELPPGGSRRMVLEYEEMLLPAGGLYRYRYVLSTERYSSRPLEEVSLAVEVSSSAGLANLYSPTYPLTVERLGPGLARASWKAENTLPSDDFELYFAPAGGGFGAGLLTGRRNNQDHFLFLFSPDTGADRETFLPKDIVFVIDRSGSMAGGKIGQARSALHYVLGQLGESDRFSLVSFNHELSTLFPTLQPVTPDVLARARSYVENLSAEGNTDLEAALRAGLSILDRSEPRPDAARIVLFLTDGLPTAGLTDDPLIASSVAEANHDLRARLHVFGVGYDVNSHLLDRLAADSGGTVTYVEPADNLEHVLTGFYDRIAYPVLTDLVLEFSGMEVSELYPERLPDLFQGGSLLLTGLYRPTDETVTVRVGGRVGDELRQYVYRFDLDQTGGHDFVPRLWATRRVGALLDRVRVEGESEDLVGQIRTLGLGYGLVTPYTIFLIEPQAEGAASGANMRLYNAADLNAVSGQTTVQARLQNQAYQQASQANLANGANVVNHGRSSLAQVGNVQVDLSLLQGRELPDGQITAEWIAQNIGVDRLVTFGSPEYIGLAQDPGVRPFLQAGPSVIFAYEGRIISVQDSADTPDDAGARPGQPGAGLGSYLLALSILLMRAILRAFTRGTRAS